MSTIQKILLSVSIILIVGALFWILVYPIFRVVNIDDPIDIDTFQKKDVVPEITPKEIYDKTLEPKLETSGEVIPKQEVMSIETVASPRKEESMKKPVKNIELSDRSKVVGTFGHPAKGFVRKLNINGKNIIRFEDFETIDGPRLHVYLVNSLDTIDEEIAKKTFVDLGFRKGTRGNINYEISNEVKLDEYNYIIYWCVPFKILFNSAKI